VWRGPHLEEPQGPPAGVSGAVQAASRARAARQRLGRRRQEVEVARRGRRGRRPRGRARWAVVQVLRALGPGLEAVREPKAAEPTRCWRVAGSTAVLVACPWADHQRLPWPHPWTACPRRRRPDEPTDCLKSLCHRSTSTTEASWGCVYPVNPKVRCRCSARLAAQRESDRGPRPPEAPQQVAGQ
jgi:hypothetical protein